MNAQENTVAQFTESMKYTGYGFFVGIVGVTAIASLNLGLGGGDSPEKKGDSKKAE